MKLLDVIRDGTTEYYCSRSSRRCTIEGSLHKDGASLIARSEEESTLNELWITEASCLNPIDESLLLGHQLSNLEKRVKILETREQLITSDNLKRHENAIEGLLRQVNDIKNQIEALKITLFKRLGA